MLLIGGSESFIEVRELAEYPSHGGSQGFKSPHLHPRKVLVTGPVGYVPPGPWLPLVVQRAANGQQPRATSPSGLAMRGSMTTADKIFISHASADRKLADLLRDTLRLRQ